MASSRKLHRRQVTVWIHDDNFSKAEVLLAPDIFGQGNLPPDALVEIVALKPSASPQDSRSTIDLIPKDSKSATLRSASSNSNGHAEQPGLRSVPPKVQVQHEALEVDSRTRYCFVAKPMPSDIRANHPTLQVSITSTIANTFGYRQRPQAIISIAKRRVWSASHVELTFRDEYLSRSDMWRLVRSELVAKTVYKGQKILFLGTIKAMVKTLYVRGRTVSSAYFGGRTVPVFRSESARYVLFIQMSREMWDFDSEGTGEIMFSRVIDGFLPELFKRWVELEARHLVSIVLFGRLEYDSHALAALQRLNNDESEGSSIDIDEGATFRDFYRVVVTDMASGQWTTILNELKKDFRVFLRDISLHQPRHHNAEDFTEPEVDKDSRTRICGQPTSALRGNILEAINIASSQYASDYIDRDLVRTGISVVVITAGTGVFEVDGQLLDLTSESLTNNGIGIDLVCLSRMPLHSVPLFKWRKTPPRIRITTSDTSHPGQSPPSLLPEESSVSARCLASTPSYGSVSQSTSQGKVTGIRKLPQWSFGVPQWIDVSYWTASGQHTRDGRRKQPQETSPSYLNPIYSKTFVPRVRMYELQMMGVMELGLANISIPYLSEGRRNHRNDHGSGDENLEHHRYKAVQFGHPANSPPATLTLGKSTSVHSANRVRGLLSSQAKQQGDMYERMDIYDNNLFSLSPSAGAAKHSTTSKHKDSATTPMQGSHRQSSIEKTLSGRQSDRSDTDTIRAPKRTIKMQAKGLGLQPKGIKMNSDSTDSRISRAISFALRGLGPSAPRAFASTEINIENAQAEQSAPNLQTNRTTGGSTRSLKSPGNSRSNRLSMLSVDSESSEPSDSGRPTQMTKTSPSRPISIKTSATKSQDTDLKSREKVRKGIGAQDVQKWPSREDSPLQSGKSKCFTSNEMDDGEAQDDTAVSVSLTNTSPWIKNVNPTNPTKNHSQAASWVGRWHHLFPRSPKTSTMKWKSLCTPASVPLTTEEFPSRRELEHHYTQTSYTVTQSEDSDLAEVGRNREWLVREMIGLRLSHGYQIVVGRTVARATGSGSSASADYYAPEKFAQDGLQIFMSMGNTIQRLHYVNGDDVQVTRFVRKPSEAVQERVESITYNPVIRTILSKSYSLRKMTLAGFSEEYSWSLADCHIAVPKDDLTKGYEQLRFWRARFVVIPVEPPPSARRPIQSMSEDNEEEIHLLGIRELTKMWQKTRYTPPEERRFKPTTGKRKDPNPLEIIFQTLNPSEVVATEIERLIAIDEGAESGQIQLLPDSELLERSTSSAAKIAQVLQSDKGVEIANRRWHLRLHYSCFKGDDFTNWLISSFKDIDSREEAVDFGNELMQHGLFHHVSTRHTFKDGNYFYTIAPEHRISRPESRSSWFPGGRRPDRSVPATPIVESGSHISPLSDQSQPGWNSTSTARPTDPRATERLNGEKRQVSVSLTKMMRIDVDHRSPKRSDRPEIVNLHYDRLHNPENCYHVELSWFNVTSKLIEDAIVTWTTQSEKYGLRLVEVPIAEACCIRDREPFRAPYRITLKVPPPPSGNIPAGTVPFFFSSNTSFAAQPPPSTDRLPYHKALLKKFNFVLDLEAASDFPPDVDVTYTWGKLGYRHPQFVHRSGVIIAQITDEGEFLLLANRLYNTRSASAKDASAAAAAGGGRFELPTRHSSANSAATHRPLPAASGIIGLNAPQPSPHPSPHARASTDVLANSRDAFTTTTAPSTGTAPATASSFITPEQVKFDLEAFCQDAAKLLAFYREVAERGLVPPTTTTTTTTIPVRKAASTGSSVLRPVLEDARLESSIPDLKLPASVVTTATGAVGTAAAGVMVVVKKKKSLGTGVGMGLSKRTNSPMLVGRDARAVVEAAVGGDPSRRRSEDSR